MSPKMVNRLLIILCLAAVVLVIETESKNLPKTVNSAHKKGNSVVKLKLSEDDIKRGVSIQISDRQETKPNDGLVRHAPSKAAARANPKANQRANHQRNRRLNRKMFKHARNEIKKSISGMQQARNSNGKVQKTISQTRNAIIQTKKSNSQTREKSRLNSSRQMMKSRAKMLKMLNKSENAVDFNSKAKKMTKPKTRFVRTKRSTRLNEIDEFQIDELQHFNEDDSSEDEEEYDEGAFNRRKSYHDNEEQAIREQEQKREAEFMNSKDGRGYASDTTHTVQFNEADEFLARHRHLTASDDATFLDVMHAMADESEQKNRDARSQPIVYGNNNFMNDEIDGDDHYENLYNEYDEYSSYEDSY